MIINLDLKKLNRAELLEMLILQSEENEQLKERIAALEVQLNERAIAISEAGSIAEAALRLNLVFEAADRAVEQYKENIRRMNAEQEAIAKVKIAKVEQQAADIIVRARVQADKSKLEADQYWSGLTERLKAFYSEHKGLQALISVMSGADAGAEQEQAQEAMRIQNPDPQRP